MDLTQSSDRWVIFGAGPLGTGVAELGVQAGKRVRLVTRSGSGPVMEGVELYRADASDLTAAREAAAGAKVVFHCANADYTKWPKLLPPIYRGILGAAEDAGARLIAADNLYMYRPGPGAITEATPVEPVSPKGALRAQLAAQLFAGKIEVALVRGSDFFGPGVVNALFGRATFEAIRKGKSARLIGNPDRLHSLTYVPDFCRALVTLAEAPSSAMGKAWLVPTAPATTTREAVEKIARLAHTQPKIQAIRGWAVRTLGLAVPMMRALVDVLYQFENDFVMDSSAFTKTFGIEPTPLETAFAQTLPPKMAPRAI